MVDKELLKKLTRYENALKRIATVECQVPQVCNDPKNPHKCMSCIAREALQ